VKLYNGDYEVVGIVVEHISDTFTSGRFILRPTLQHVRKMLARRSAGIPWYVPALLGALALWLSARPLMPLAPLPTLTYDPSVAPGTEEPPPAGIGPELDLGVDTGVNLAIGIGVL
jgi:hypothetical protein